MPILTLEDFDSGLSSKIGFAIGQAQAAAALRKLADAVESGQCLPGRVNLVGKTSGDEFHQHVLLFQYSERKEV